MAELGLILHSESVRQPRMHLRWPHQLVGQAKRIPSVGIFKPTLYAICLLDGVVCGLGGKAQCANTFELLPSLRGRLRATVLLQNKQCTGEGYLTCSALEVSLFTIRTCSPTLV